MFCLATENQAVQVMNYVQRLTLRYEYQINNFLYLEQPKQYISYDNKYVQICTDLQVY